MSVLIVDDSVMNRRMMKRTLQQHGIGAYFEEAGDGLELLSLLGVPLPTGDDRPDSFHRSGLISDIDSNDNPSDVKSYDVILLDINMLHMDGTEAVRLLREHGYTGLVVGVTGIAVEEEMQLFCQQGVDYALPKPFVVEDFVRVMLMHFEHD
jgi:CheY-like chemotaxis protein